LLQRATLYNEKVIRPGAGESVKTRWLALLGAVSFCWFHSARATEPPQSSAVPTVAELAAEPVILDPSMAPNGHWIAARIVRGGQPSLALIDADGTDFPTRMITLAGDESVDWFQWAGAQRLVVGVSGPKTARLLAFDAATLKPIELGRSAEGFADRDLVYVDPVGRYLLLSVASGRSHLPSIYRIDLATGARVLSVKAQDGVGSWLADGAGVVRAGVATHGNRRWLVYRSLESERFRRAMLRGADAQDIEARTALLNLTRLGWGQNNPAFRQLFTTRFIPDAGSAEMKWFNDLQRVSTSSENAARLINAFSRVDVRPLLASVRVPTIVFHAEHDGVVPFDEGRLLAAGIPGARFVPLPSRNHLVLETEPAWTIFLRELGAFLGWTEQV